MWGQDSHVSLCVPLICSPLLSRILPDTWVMTGKIDNNQWYLTAKLHGHSIPSAVMVKRKSVKIIWKICASSCQAASISPSSSRDRAALRSLESLEFSVETWRQNETKHFPILLIWTKMERLMVQWLAFLMVSFCFLVDGCCLFFLPPSYFATHMLPAAVGRPTKKNEHQQGFFTQGWFSKKRTCDRRSASVGNGRAESLQQSYHHKTLSSLSIMASPRARRRSFFLRVWSVLITNKKHQGSTRSLLDAKLSAANQTPNYSLVIETRW